MKKEIADMWCAALRSGEYTQGRGSLCTVNDDGKQFCCLGVLCELYKQHDPSMDVRYSHQTADSKFVLYNSYSCNLPPEVCLWSGVKTQLGFRCKNGKSLVQLNDACGFSFIEIANVIEEEWEAL